MIVRVYIDREREGVCVCVMERKSEGRKTIMNNVSIDANSIKRGPWRELSASEYIKNEKMVKNWRIFFDHATFLNYLFLLKRSFCDLFYFILIF